jgi:hypothetical protein
VTTSPLHDWFDKAGVRVDPRRLLRDEVDSGKQLFTRGLIPYLAHPHVQALEPRVADAIIARHTYNYFAFTAHFETRVVNRATELIANGRLDTPTAPDLRFDAYKIYCDEAYHALYSFDVIRQLEMSTGIAALTYHFDPVLAALDAAAAQSLPHSGTLPQLLQVVVFETLVTTLLAELPNDPDLVGLVRCTVRDHARDEGRHHAYFSQFFRELWTGLDEPTRRQAAVALPRLIALSLRPTLQAVAGTLQAAGLSRGQASEVLADVYPDDEIRRTARQQSVQSVRLFRAAGVLDLPEAQAAFHEEGLI